MLLGFTGFSWVLLMGNAFNALWNGFELSGARFCFHFRATRPVATVRRCGIDIDISSIDIVDRYRRSISSITSAAVASAGRSISPATHCAPRSSFVLSSFFSLPFNLFFVFAFVFGVFFWFLRARADGNRSVGLRRVSFNKVERRRAKFLFF